MAIVEDGGANRAAQAEIIPLHGDMGTSPAERRPTPKSRRAILTGAAASIVAAPAIASSPADDPLYSVWREWRTLFERHWAATDRLAEIDAGLPDWARNPRVLVLVGQVSKHEFWASTPGEIREIMGFGHPMFTQSAKTIAKAEAFEAELRARQREAAAEYERSGYEDQCSHCDALWEAMDPLKNRIEESPSTSPIAIAAKLDLAFASVEDVKQDLGDPPISYMGYVLRSLWDGLPADMQDALRPAATHDGLVYQLYAPATGRGLQS
jgi:hypothetical protein